MSTEAASPQRVTRPMQKTRFSKYPKSSPGKFESPDAPYRERPAARPEAWFSAAALLALIGIWGLVAWLFGLPLGGEIRSDPFGLDTKSSSLPRLADAYLSTIPHPAFARMHVVPSGLAGALTLKSLPGGEANAPAPTLLPSEFVNAPETAMDEIRRTLVSPAAAALERTKTKHRFQLAELAPSTKSEKGRGKSSEQQKFDGKQGPTPEPDKGQSPAQSSEPDATKGGQSPVESAQPDKSVQPNQPANPGLLAALLLSGKDGKGHLVAIDTTKNFFAFDEIKKAWRPYQAVDISTLVDGALIGKDFSPPTFAVGYNLSTTNSTWLLLGWPIAGPNSVKPFLRDSLNGTAPRFPRRTEAGQFNYAEWSLGEYEDLVIQQSSLPSFGLGSFTDFPNEQDTGKGGSTFYSVMFAPRVRGDWSIWAGSDRGLLEMHEADIALRPLPTAVPIRSIFFESPTQGWATSGWSDGNPEGTARPVVLETRDGGQNWQHVPYRWLPAPWVYVCFVLAVGAFWRGTTARAALSHKAPTLSIAEHGVSDNPIGLNDPDALGLVPIALAMSRFLRNVQTTPSLAIGVAGPWGSGKSSLMKLVREDLEDRGVRSVEFNAWHHQQEESLLAALLTVVRAQAVPPFWTWSGLRVRLRGGWCRIKCNPFGVVAVLAIAAFLGFAIWLLGPRLLAWINGTGAEGTEGKQQSDVWAALGISGSVILLSKGLWTVLQPLSAMPAKLLATISPKSSNKDMEQQLAFRYRFAREFRTFCDALRHPPHPGLVVFVDDLDRCGPRQTVEILEALNFITTAGNCFIILGFDEQKVKAAIADVYKDTVLELHESDIGDFRKPRKEDLFRFATNYLEKLVHLVVPVPRATGEAVEKLLGLIPVAPPSRDERQKRRLRHLAAEMAIPLLLLFGGIALATSLIWPRAPSAIAAVEAWRKGALPHETPGGTAQGSSDRATSSQPSEQAPTAEALPVTALPAPVPPSWIEGVPAAGFILVLLVILMLPVAWLTRHLAQEAIIDDSPSFREALGIWDDLIAIRRQTPRAIKRFMNRLRFLAMRVRDVAQEELARGGTPPLDEPLLVTYAAMEELGVAESRRAHAGARDSDVELKEQLAQGLDKFAARFHRDPDDPRSRQTYQRIAGIVEERHGNDAPTAPEGAAAEQVKPKEPRRPRRPRAAPDPR